MALVTKHIFAEPTKLEHLSVRVVLDVDASSSESKFGIVHFLRAYNRHRIEEGLKPIHINVFCHCMELSYIKGVPRLFKSRIVALIHIYDSHNQLG